MNTRTRNFHEFTKYFIEKYKKYRSFTIEPMMPILLIETFSRHVMMNRARLLPPGLGLLELLSSLDSAFRQVSELLRGLDIPNVHVK